MPDSLAINPHARCSVLPPLFEHASLVSRRSWARRWSTGLVDQALSGEALSAHLYFACVGSAQGGGMCPPRAGDILSQRHRVPVKLGRERPGQVAGAGPFPGRRSRVTLAGERARALLTAGVPVAHPPRLRSGCTLIVRDRVVCELFMGA